MSDSGTRIMTPEEVMKDLRAQQEQLSHAIDIGRQQTMLIAFESGHYKKVTGSWKGDSVWTHWIKPDGKAVHINKDKVEYYEEL